MGEGLPKPITDEGQKGQPAIIEVTDGAPAELPPEAPLDQAETDNDNQPVIEHEHTIDHSDDEDAGRWDEQKARTMASVLSKLPAEYGRPDNNMDDTDREMRSAVGVENTLRDNPEYDDWITKNLKQKVEDRIKETSKRLDSATAEDDRKEYEGDLAKLQGELDEINEHKLERVKQYHRRLGEAMDLKSERRLSPYVGLYDSDPDKFANMPTSEFMEIADKFSVVEGDISFAEVRRGYVEQCVKHISYCLEKSEMTDGEYIRDSFREVRNLLAGRDRVAAEALKDEWDSITTDSFNKSPRQIAEAQRDFLRKGVSQINDRVAELTLQKYKMLGKKPEEEVVAS